MGRLTATKSGEIATFRTPYETDVKGLKVHFSPIQSGTGDAAPDNIRPITGWNTVEAYGRYEYLSNVQITSNKTINSSGEITSETGMAVTDYIPVKENEVYTFKFVSTYAARTRRIYGYDSSQDPTESLASISWATAGNSHSMSATIPSGVSYIRVCYYNADLKKTLFKNDTVGLRVNWKKLPDTYQEVEYIENTGTAYINTGIECTSDLAVKFKFSCPNVVNSAICGGINTVNNPIYFRHHCSPTEANFYWIQNSDSNASSIKESTFQMNTVYEVSIDPIKGEGIINGERKTFTPLSQGLTTGKNYGIMARISDTNEIQQKYSRFYYFQFYRNNVMIGNFIPCYRKSDNEIGMYDTVSNTFYTNSGTGSFTKGNDVGYAKDIYGGYVDLITGELVQEWDIVEYDGSEDENWIMTSYERFSIASPHGPDYIRTSNKEIICNKLYPVGANGTGRGRDLCCYTWSTTNVGIRIDNDTTSVDLLKAWLVENPVIICYKLAEPITYQLPQSQLQTLRSLAGVNNVWSNADSVDVSYELIDTPDIQRVRQRVISGQPHLESASGALVSFATDMKAPLKECKVNFLPVQSGTGDPAPDNIRSITGWTGIELCRCNSNLLPNAVPTIAFKGSFGTGSTTISSSTTYRCYTFYVGKNRDIYYKRKTSGVSTLIAFCDTPLFDRTNSVIYDAYTMTNRSEQARNSGDHPYMVLSFPATHIETSGGSFDTNEVMYTPSETATYESRENNTPIYVDWTSEAGMIYGGYIDLVKGELVQEWDIADLSALSWSTSGTTNMRVRSTDLVSVISIPSKPSNLPDIICEKYKSIQSSANLSSYPNTMAVLETGAIIMKYETDDPMPTGNMAYKLAQPIHYTLTPQQILTLKKTNNLWSNANGTIDVKYYKH